jgi:hypothetical protein
LSHILLILETAEVHELAERSFAKNVPIKVIS